MHILQASFITHLAPKTLLNSLNYYIIGKMLNLLLEQGSFNKLCELSVSCLRKAVKPLAFILKAKCDLQNQLSESQSSNFAGIKK